VLANQNHVFRPACSQDRRGRGSGGRKTVGGVGAHRAWDHRSHAPYGPASILFEISSVRVYNRIAEADLLDCRVWFRDVWPLLRISIKL
jgi:hypothetical protein